MPELPSLKITMVGTSGTGKSCYLYGTYARLLDGVGKFNFCPSDYIQGLDLGDRWETFINDSTWPPGTVETTSFSFDIILKGKKIADFDWIDYRGGVLSDASSPEELNGFLNYLQESNGVLVCIPADLLKLACLSSEKGSKSKEISSASSILRNYQTLMNKIVQFSIPVVLTITKWDIFTTPGKDSKENTINEEKAYKTILKFLKNKFKVLFQENSPAVMITCVSLGDFGPGQVQGGQANGVVRPVNLHVPVLFPVWMALDTQIQALNNNINVQNRNQGANRRQWEEVNKLHPLIRWWNGDNRRELEDQRRTINEMISNLGKDLASLKEMMKDIKDEFNGTADIFIGGECVLNSSSHAEEE